MADDSQMAAQTGDVLVRREDTGLSRRKYLALVTALAGSPVLAGCSSDGSDTTATSGGEPKMGGHLQTSLVSPINHFDLHINGLTVASIVGYQSVEKLFQPNHDLELESLLAKDVSISDDGLTWDITIRQGAMFHPPYERELKAADIITNFERVLSEETGSFRSLTLSAVDTMEATGDYTLRLKFSEQQAWVKAGLGGYFGIPIFSPEALENGNIREKPVGTGPFVFKNWVPKDKIELTAHDNYWQDNRPYVDKVTFRPMSEASVMMTELTDGNLDILHSTPTDFESILGNNDSLTVQKTDGLGYRALHINPGSEPTDGRAVGLPTTDPKVRKAVLEAVDRTAYVKIIEGGLGTATQNYFPEKHPWYIDYAPYSMKSNVEKAEQLIKKSEYSAPVPVNIISASGDPILRQLGIITRDALSKAGFKPNLVEYDVGTWVTKSEAFKYDINVNYYTGWFHPNELKPWIYPEGLTQMKYETKNRDRIFELFNKINKTMDKDGADPINKELQKRLIDDAAYVPVYHPKKVQTMRNSVENFTVQPFHLAYRLDEVWLNE